MAVAGCASSDELAARSNARMTSATEAAAAGDLGRARQEQRRAEHLYQRASARAFEEARPAPPEPPNPPLPLFDPQLGR